MYFDIEDVNGPQVPPLTKHYKAVGCNNCYHTGYQGRKAIYEIIPITKTLIDHIRRNDLEIDTHIKKNKIGTLKSNAIELIRQGVTSVDEVYALLSD